MQLGYVHTTPKKIKAIQQAPHPGNIQQLRSFLGLVQYYAKPGNNHRATKLVATQGSLDQSCEAVLTTLKESLSSSPVLVHYDTQNPLRLACDASAYGIGTVISHIMPDNSEKPIYFALAP